MSFRDRPEFFKKLRKTTKSISNDITELKNALKVPPTDDTLAYEKCGELLDKIKELKKESLKILKDISPKLAISRNYYIDVEELICEIDDEVIGTEGNLESYGYERIPRDYSIIPVESKEEIATRFKPKKSETPVLFTYADMLARRELERKCLLNKSPPSLKAESESDLDVTPVLDLDAVAVEYEVTDPDSDPLPRAPPDRHLYSYRRIARRLEDDF